MRITFSRNSREDYVSWQKEDKKILTGINQLVKDIQQTPFHGIGNPEPLKYDLAGFWSRRIDRGHRFVYQVFDKEILIYSCKYHYAKITYAAQ